MIDQRKQELYMYLSALKHAGVLILSQYILIGRINTMRVSKMLTLVQTIVKSFYMHVLAVCM